MFSLEAFGLSSSLAAIGGGDESGTLLHDDAARKDAAQREGEMADGC